MVRGGAGDCQFGVVIRKFIRLGNPTPSDGAWVAGRKSVGVATIMEPFPSRRVIRQSVPRGDAET